MPVGVVIATAVKNSGGTEPRTCAVFGSKRTSRGKPEAFAFPMTPGSGVSGSVEDDKWGTEYCH